MTARSWLLTAAGVGVVAALVVLLRRIVRLAGPGRPAEDADLAELRRRGRAVDRLVSPA